MVLNTCALSLPLPPCHALSRFLFVMFFVCSRLLMFYLCVRSVIRGVRVWRRRRRVWKQRLRRWKVGWGPFFSPLAFSSLISHTNFSWLTSGICLAVLVPVDPRTLSTHLAPCSLFHSPSRGAQVGVCTQKSGGSSKKGSLLCSHDQRKHT